MSAVARSKRKAEFQSPEDARRSDPERIVSRRLADDREHWVVLTRWLDRQVEPPRWRAKNERLRLTREELAYYAERAS